MKTKIIAVKCTLIVPIEVPIDEDPATYACALDGINEIIEFDSQWNSNEHRWQQ